MLRIRQPSIFFSFKHLVGDHLPQAGWQPYPLEKHEVFIKLSVNFPMQAPKVFWQSPIYHPNVDAKTGKVCLGVLEEKYRPGLDFGQLCQMLVDIAAYHNYEVREYYNQEAAQWARSEEGQMAITARGGKSLIDWALHIIEQEISAPPSLNIKRCD